MFRHIITLYCEAHTKRLNTVYCYHRVLKVDCDPTVITSESQSVLSELKQAKDRISLLCREVLAWEMTTYDFSYKTKNLHMEPVNTLTL